jgi:fucose 4-O-acetylase-like acetyltransferase
MNTTKRIEYIDALRGFTMILVVAVHVYSLCFMHGSANEFDLSYNNFFGLFRMPLFYFISGFVFYKLDRYWDYATLKHFISSKVRVQLFSTLVFFFLFCWLYQKDIYHSLFDTQKAGYWFTFILFVYFILYIVIDKTVCWITKKGTFNKYTIITSFIVGLLLYYFINNGLLLNILSPQITTLSSFAKWQYFLFFSFGCYIHKYYESFLTFQDIKYVKGGIILLFVCSTIFIFYQNQTDILIHNYILKLFSSLSGITLVMFLFKDNEKHISNFTKIGSCLQFIGKHTLDIYLIHYFFLPYNMSFIGKWLGENPNYLLEFSMSLTLALLVIVCCLLVSKIIRLSPILAYYLLGQKCK